jgi:hypothetical protein
VYSVLMVLLFSEVFKFVVAIIFLDGDLTSIDFSETNIQDQFDNSTTFKFSRYSDYFFLIISSFLFGFYIERGIKESIFCGSVLFLLFLISSFI